MHHILYTLLLATLEADRREDLHASAWADAHARLDAAVSVAIRRGGLPPEEARAYLDHADAGTLPGPPADPQARHIDWQAAPDWRDALDADLEPLEVEEDELGTWLQSLRTYDLQTLIHRAELVVRDREAAHIAQVVRSRGVANAQH